MTTAIGALLANNVEVFAVLPFSVADPVFTELPLRQTACLRRTIKPKFRSTTHRIRPVRIDVLIRLQENVFLVSGQVFS